VPDSTSYQCERCEEQSTDQMLRTGKDGQRLCRDCYNQGPDKDLGIIDDWQYRDGEHPQVALQTEEGHEHSLGVSGKDHAERLGDAYSGMMLVDRGDSIDTEGTSTSPGDRVREAFNR